MTIRELLAGKPSTAVTTIRPDQTLAEAIARLCEHRIGALLVVDAAENPQGIITERDIMRAANQNIQGFGRQPVAQIMTRELICGLPDDHVSYVMHVMTQNKIRHLPIVEGGRVIGMVSIGDVIKAQLDTARVENRLLQDYLHLHGRL